MFSLLLRPHSDARHMARLGFAACVSAARAADRCGAPDCGIKWPNDLVFPAGLPYQNAPGLPPSSPYLKWGGILVETGLDAETRPWAIVGVGLNVGPVPADAAFDFPFTSLSSHGGAVVTAEEMLQFFLDEMEWCWRCAEAGGDEIWQTVRGEWRRRDILFGQQVRALTPSGAVRGTAQGIDDSGALRLETSHGTLLVDAGDVHLQPGG